MSRDSYVSRDIRGERQTRGANRAIARLAERQDGLITRDQLRDRRLSDDQIDRLLAAGRLLLVHRGVYAVGHRKLTERGRMRAALLAMGEDAVLSGRSAAAHWGVLPPARGPVDVALPNQRRAQDGIRPHEVRLARKDWRTKDGIKVTSPERTLLDLAASHPNLLDRAIRESHYLRLTSPPSLARFCKRNEGRHGCRALRKAIEQADLNAGPTHEELERRFRRFLKKHKFPLPQFNQPLEINGRTFKPDCLWHDYGLVVELDSRRAHDTPHAFEEDRIRDRAFQLAGYRVVRITWRQLHDEPEAVLMDLTKFLVDAVKGPR